MCAQVCTSVFTHMCTRGVPAAGDGQRWMRGGIADELLHACGVCMGQVLGVDLGVGCGDLETPIFGALAGLGTV